MSSSIFVKPVFNSSSCSVESLNYLWWNYTLSKDRVISKQVLEDTSKKVDPKGYKERLEWKMKRQKKKKNLTKRLLLEKKYGKNYNKRLTRKEKSQEASVKQSHKIDSFFAKPEDSHSAVIDLSMTL